MGNDAYGLFLKFEDFKHLGVRSGSPNENAIVNVGMNQRKVNMK